MSEDMIGPPLPPHMIEATSPSKEDQTTPIHQNNTLEPPNKKRRVMGPSLDDLVVEPGNPVIGSPVIGPPELGTFLDDAGNEDDNVDAQWAAVMDRNRVQEKQEQKREDWMLSLPSGPS